jgi:two-component system sensor histidine kinase/response regulator
MNKATILLVDDSPTNLHVLLDYLKDTGFETLIAQSGESALRQLKYAQPDIILMDVMMPGIDGFETCRRLKENESSRGIPVIFMTALSDTVDKVRGFEVGGVDYITKPLQHEEVLARVNAHLTIRNLQKQLQEKNKQLSELNASKDKFFSIIAHDLRNPFAGLLGFTRMVAEGFDDWSKDEIQDILGELQKSAENLYELLENLLSWSRLQRGVMEYTPELGNVDQIVRHNIDLFTPIAEQKQITLRNSVDQTIMVFADIKMFDTVIRNLVSNALKFTENEGSIEISAMQDEKFVTVAVSDTGIGIPQEDLSKLFQIDVKYSQVGTAGEQGTGLGLVLCKDLIEKNGGEIEVESEVGKGTIFRFTRPTKPDGLGFPPVRGEPVETMTETLRQAQGER